MRDDQTFDHENAAPVPPDRLADGPSSRSVRGPRQRLLNPFGPYPQSRIRHRLGPARAARLAIATGALCCLGLAAYAETLAAVDDAAPGPAAGQSQLAEQAVIGAPPAAQPRVATKAKDKTGTIVPPDDPPTQDAEPALPPGHKESGPVAGLSHVQMNNAKAIVWTGVDMGMPRRALIIAVATAMQESTLHNRASEVLPESKNYPHQGTGWDHDSVGLFQQRTSTGWGPVAKLMDPAYASQQFYQALMQVPGWQDMPVTLAAQAVQVSAFPWHYAKHETRATKVVNALTDVP